MHACMHTPTAFATALRLQNLALERLVAGRLLPFIRIAAADVAKAADRIQRTVAALPAEWFRGGEGQQGRAGAGGIFEGSGRLSYACLPACSFCNWYMLGCCEVCRYGVRTML